MASDAMAATSPPSPPSRSLSSKAFVESCGAVLFDLSEPADKKICLVQLRYNKEWLLAKGRRNIGETRSAAAVREVMEETGYRCLLLPVTMSTRATVPGAAANEECRARVHEKLTEPFMCTIKELKRPKRTKIVWWFVAQLEASDKGMKTLPGERMWSPKFFSCKEAIEKLTHENDRDVLVEAVQIIEATFGQTSAHHANPVQAQDDGETGVVNVAFKPMNVKTTKKAKGIQRKIKAKHTRRTVTGKASGTTDNAAISRSQAPTAITKRKEKAKRHSVNRKARKVQQKSLTAAAS